MDLREYIQQLDEAGVLVNIDEPVHWKAEVGAILRYTKEHGKRRAIIFNQIMGAMAGARLFGGVFSDTSRLAVALGLPPSSSYHDVVECYGSLLDKEISPIVVDRAPCQENCLFDEKIDLYSLPAPQFHVQDGGQYIATLNIGVCRDPESDWVNWGTYRGQIHTRNSTGVLMNHLNHGGIIMKKYHERGEPMEYAQFFGGDPIYQIVGTTGIEYGRSEVNVAGGVRGEPVKLVKCKTVNLHVPADAELVLEGTIAPGDYEAEGPFGEYPGYIVSDVTPRPVFRVSAVTYRSNPILPCTWPGESVLWYVEIAAALKVELTRKGIPVVKVAIPDGSGAHAVVVSTKTPHAGIARLIANVVWGDRVGRIVPYVIVVNDDVDPANLVEVFHSLVTKCHPVNSLHVERAALTTALTPFVPRGKFVEDGWGGGHCLFDCTWPISWRKEETPVRLSFNASFSDDIKRKVLAGITRWDI